MRPELRSVIQIALGPFVCDVLITRNSHGQRIFANPEFQSKRNTNAQHYLKPGTPNIKPRYFFLSCFVPDTSLCDQPLIKLENTKVLLNWSRHYLTLSHTVSTHNHTIPSFFPCLALCVSLCIYVRIKQYYLNHFMLCTSLHRNLQYVLLVHVSNRRRKNTELREGSNSLCDL